MKSNHNSKTLYCFQRVIYKDIKTINFNKTARKANEWKHIIAYLAKLKPKEVKLLA